LLNFREAALHVVERADIGAIELVLLDRGQTVSTAVLAPVQALTVASRIRDQRVARGRGRRRGERPMTAAAGIFCRAWPEGPRRTCTSAGIASCSSSRSWCSASGAATS
jgi:hypothetical protein